MQTFYHAGVAYAEGAGRKGVAYSRGPLCQMGVAYSRVKIGERAAETLSPVSPRYAPAKSVGREFW